MAFGSASQLGVGLFEDKPRLEAWPKRSGEDVENIIRAVYSQVLGNMYVMESQRLTVPESQFQRGEISVREFVRQVAKSDLYRSRFFDGCSPYRTIELNFKHLLGRAPESYEEMKAHSDIYHSKGFDADIDSYIDSAEYEKAYGENTVPFYRGYKTRDGQNMVGFTYMVALVRGASSSDISSLAGTSSVLNKALIQDSPLAVAGPSGSSADWYFRYTALSANSPHCVGPLSEGKIFRLEVTGFRPPNAVNGLSKFRRSNRVYLVPFEKLTQEYQQIHKQGGVIASITPVN